MTDYPDCMVDLETTGTNPETAHIIQIAAVRFNLAEKIIDTNEMFDRCLMPALPGRYWDEDTRAWWAKMPTLRDSILDRGEVPEGVWADFVSFLERTPASKPLRLWAKPISFEFPLLQSYARQLRKPMPLRHTAGRDLYSYAEGRGREWWSFAKTVEFHGDEHNALHDVLHQIELAMRA